METRSDGVHNHKEWLQTYGVLVSSQNKKVDKLFETSMVNINRNQHGEKEVQRILPEVILSKDLFFQKFKYKLSWRIRQDDWYFEVLKETERV